MKLSRRDFLKATGAASLSAFLGSYIAFAETEVTMLTWNHFVPPFNGELEKIVAEWAEDRGVKARIDYESLGNLPSRLATEVEAKRGHDVVMLFNYGPALYKQNLIGLDDIAADLGNEYGPWLKGGKFLCFLDGEWQAIPWSFQSLLANIRVDYWDQIDMKPEDVAELNWDGLLEKAKEMDEIGHPIALCIGENLDSYGFVFPLLWSFGAQHIDKQGKVVINSAETRAALEYANKLFPYMPYEMIGWDNSGNNQFMFSGRGSYTENPPSIWAVAKIKDLPIADKLDHVPMPSGPEGAFRVADYNSLGVWEFSPNIDLAKDLIKFLLEKDQFYRQVKASWGYNEPTLEQYEKNPYYEKEHVLRYYAKPVEEVRPSGYPAAPSSKTQIAYNLLIVPIMFAKVVTGELSIDKSIEWAEKQLTRIY